LTTERDAKAGPTGKEWALSLATTVLLGNQVFEMRSMSTAQTGERYYSQTPGVRPLQGAAVAVDALIVGCTLAWIVLAKLGPWFRQAVFLLALLGLGLVWTELLVAAGTLDSQVFRLTQLPIRPTNNLGVVGGTVFFAYMVTRGPRGKLAPWQSVMVKSLLVLGFWMLQWVAWDVVQRSSGGGARIERSP
jgi:hypothetical protein